MAALCPSLLDCLADGSMDALKCQSLPSVGHIHLFCQAATFSQQESVSAKCWSCCPTSDAQCLKGPLNGTPISLYWGRAKL